MRRWMGKWAVVLSACALTAFGADTLKLQNAGASSNMGGVYTSPYGISVNGGPTTLMICDDFTTDIGIGLTWQANATTLTQIDAASIANLKFANSPYNSHPGILGGPSNAVQDYATAAVLAAQLTSLPNIGTGAEDKELAGELSYAIWGVFDAALLNSVNTGFGTLTSMELGKALDYLSQAQALVAAAVTASGAVDLSKITINGHSLSMTVYTPDPLSASQEFLQVSVPEPTSAGMLAFDAVLIGGLIMGLRRRLAGGVR